MSVKIGTAVSNGNIEFYGKHNVSSFLFDLDEFAIFNTFSESCILNMSIPSDFSIDNSGDIPMISGSRELHYHTHPAIRIPRATLNDLPVFTIGLNVKIEDWDKANGDIISNYNCDEQTLVGVGLTKKNTLTATYWNRRKIDSPKSVKYVLKKNLFRFDLVVDKVKGAIHLYIDSVLVASLSDECIKSPLDVDPRILGEDCACWNRDRLAAGAKVGMFTVYKGEMSEQNMENLANFGALNLEELCKN